MDSTSGTASTRHRQAMLGALSIVAASTVVVVSAAAPSASAETSPEITQLDLVSPQPGDEAFGETVVVLSNGNFVVTDPRWDDGSTADVGAVYLYDGSTNSVISTLTGSTVGDQAGSGGIAALAGGGFVVASPEWSGAGEFDVGAATWVDGDTGLDGAITTTNSLHGTTEDDKVGSGGVTALANGDYVVASPIWRNGPAISAGAATWGNGDGGTTGAVTTTNSLHGSQTGDNVSLSGVTALTDGDYVVASPNWGGVVANGGAATWARSDGSTTGAVSTANSLYGPLISDRVSSAGITALANGHFVVASQWWSLPSASQVGAATWAAGDGTTVGPVTTLNSVHGSTANDWVARTVTALTDGDYVVNSPRWTSPTASRVGAVTWATGAGPTTGAVSVSNSLHGSTFSDRIGGSGITALTNGNYVVASSEWDGPGGDDVGAATWGDGSGGTTGAVTTSNSLHGTSNDAEVGFGGVTALANGHYVVSSPLWDLGGNVNAGAATWGHGAGGTVGAVSTGNSLHGTTSDDAVSRAGITALAGGDFVVGSESWNNGATQNVGAATWSDGDTPTLGPVTATNSLTGSSPFDEVAVDGVTALSTGDYVVNSRSAAWSGVSFAGAATLGVAAEGVSGSLTASNSVIGTPPGSLEPALEEVTSGNAVIAPTTQDRVVLMLLDIDGSPSTTTTTTTVPTPSPVPPVSSLPPERFVDTRAVGVTLDGTFQSDGKRAAGSEYRVQIGGRGNIPADAIAVVANVTAIGAENGGFITAHPCLDPRPLSSSLNYSQGINLGNEIIAPLSASGELCLFTSATVHMTVDVTGYVDRDSPLHPTSPARFLDTRPNGETIDNQAEGSGALTGGTEITVPIGGRNDIPANAAAVIANVTAVQATRVGFITAHSCLATAPNVASLNYGPAVNRGNEAIIQLNADGELCLFTSTDTHLTLDVVGYLPAEADLTAITPSRLLDTRPNGQTIDGQSQASGQQTADTEQRIQVTGRAGIPTDATSVVLNVTAIQPASSGFITIHPCQDPKPNTASLNYTTGVNGGNDIIATLDPVGGICVYTSAITHLTLDTTNWL